MKNVESIKDYLNYENQKAFEQQYSDEHGCVVFNDILVSYVGDMEKIVIPANVDTISEGVFRGKEESIKTIEVSQNSKLDLSIFADFPIDISINVRGENGEITDSFSVSKLNAEKNLAFLEYEIVDGEATITGCDKSISGVVVLPDTIEGCPVTKIGKEAFYDCSLISNVVIPDSVTSIGKGAFVSCETLSEVTIGKNVETIGDYAFGGCSNLENINISNGVKKIGNEAFAWCKSLNSVAIPDNVTKVGEGAFKGCENLKSATIGNGLTQISDSMFQYCHSLKGLTIGQNVKSIGSHAFNGCKALFIANIPKSITTIGDAAFSYCEKLRYVNGGNGIKEIRDKAFNGCVNLRTPPHSVKVLQQLANLHLKVAKVLKILQSPTVLQI